MKLVKFIAFLVVLGASFASCSKLEPLNDRVNYTTVSEEKAASAVMLPNSDSNNGGGSITDPDHDEEHDKDNVKDVTDKN